MTNFLYLLHFDEPRHHARHYLGSSEFLIDRLKRHKDGLAAKLTAALVRDGQTWVLAGLWVPRNEHLSIRILERSAKKRHNGASYCPICHKDPATPAGCMSYPIPKTLTQGVP